MVVTSFMGSYKCHGITFFLLVSFPEARRFLATCAVCARAAGSLQLEFDKNWVFFFFFKCAHHKKSGDVIR